MPEPQLCLADDMVVSLTKVSIFEAFGRPWIHSGVKIIRQNEKGVKTPSRMPGRNSKARHERFVVNSELLTWMKVSSEG